MRTAGNTYEHSLIWQLYEGYDHSGRDFGELTKRKSHSGKRIRLT